MNQQKCQALISGIVGQMLSERPINPVSLTRAIMDTGICDSIALSDLRQSYRDYLGGEIIYKLQKFQYLSPKESDMILQATLHYSIWAKRVHINAMDFRNKCALLTSHPFQYLRSTIAPMSKN